MSSQITNYQCPACTGPLHYAGDSGRLECDYCGSSFSVEEIEAMFAAKEEAAEEAAAAQQAAVEEENSTEGEYATGEYWDAAAEGLKAYNCPSCGAELIMDETTAATSCPYCGNPSIIPGVFSQTLRPDYIIPFRLDKADAVKMLNSYYKGKKLLPRTFSSDNHIEEVKGVYVPFWLFDGEVDADLRFHATKVHTRISGDDEIITTQHFKVQRRGTVPYKNVPVDASSKMPDEYMESIEPFEYQDMVEFSTAYLPGYMADRYDVSAEESAKRAEARAAASAVDNLESTVGFYATKVLEHRSVNVRRGRVKYALLPVWMLSTKYHGKNYLFAMNGQTGRFVGDLPIDRGRYWALVAKFALPVAAVLAFLLY